MAVEVVQHSVESDNSSSGAVRPSRLRVAGPGGGSRMRGPPVLETLPSCYGAMRRPYDVP